MAAIAILFHCAFLVIVWQSQIGWLILLCSLLLIIGLYHCLTHYASLSAAKAIASFDLYPDKVLLTNNQGELMEAQLLVDSFICSYFIILNVRAEQNKRRKSLLIFSDAITYENWRRLRFFLNIHKNA